MKKFKLPLTPTTYQDLYEQSISDPDTFWADQATDYLNWYKPWDSVLSGNLSDHNVEWFKGAELNACYNCLDRHLEHRGDQTAIIWESDDPAVSKNITYNELFKEVCRFANALKNLGAKKGDRICIYMPMIPEAAVAILACARIGAIHSVVFGGFSPEALKNRIHDANCSIVITADEGIRGNKTIPLKHNVDTALKEASNVNHVVVVKRTGNTIDWNTQHDVWYHNIVQSASDHCPAEIMSATDPLFILYTSGSTGKPKGVLHTTGGYLLYAAITHHVIFNYQEGDIYWCSADIGWITGHSYIIYGPLCNGATTLMFEGVPNYPDASRFWQVIDKHQVTIFYTAPTAIRALMREGDEPLKATKRSSLKLLGSVGEPINPEAWRWYHDKVGKGHCPIVDTWWQTETGGILLTPFINVSQQKPGCASWPFFGIAPAVVDDDDGNPVKTGVTGKLIITKPWPGMMNTVYGDHERFINTYFKAYPGNYFTEDGAFVDEEGYYWITGRTDDVINVSGHRIGTAEVESALVSHHDIAEAAVVGKSHDIKGQSIYAYVTPIKGIDPNDALKQELIQIVRQHIGAFATPEVIHWTTALPKTRSGKIMRRILRKIANGQVEDLGDTSTLANPEVVDELL